MASKPIVRWFYFNPPLRRNVTATGPYVPVPNGTFKALRAAGEGDT